MSHFQQPPATGNQQAWPPQGQHGPMPGHGPGLPPVPSHQLPGRPPRQRGQGPTWWKSRPVIGGAALLVGVAIGAAGGNDSTSPTAVAGSTPTVTVSVPADGAAPAPTVTVTAPAPAAKTVQVPGPAKTVTAPPPGPAVAIPADGTWLVGTDIKPGTYRSSPDGDCYWARLKNTSGDFEAILANGNGTNQVVTLKKTDKALESARCAPWTRIR
jgi:hypothetical protein